MTMQAVVLHRFGGPEVLVPAEVPRPEPGPGEIRVRVHAVVVARTKDVALRSGRHPLSGAVRLPHLPGTEHAGTVDATGPDVHSGLLGRRVAVSAGPPLRGRRPPPAGRGKGGSPRRALGGGPPRRPPPTPPAPRGRHGVDTHARH